MNVKITIVVAQFCSLNFRTSVKIELKTCEPLSRCVRGRVNVKPSITFVLSLSSNFENPTE